MLTFSIIALVVSFITFIVVFVMYRRSTKQFRDVMKRADDMLKLLNTRKEMGRGWRRKHW